jgi:hypothetical protein
MFFFIILFAPIDYTTLKVFLGILYKLNPFQICALTPIIYG